MITVKEIEAALPAHLKSSASQPLADRLNSVVKDPEIAKNIRENFVSYMNVLKEGRFKTEDYLNAVAYVSHKMMGYNNQESYAKTFPARYAALTAKGATDKDISAYVSAFNKGRLVNLIMEQTLIPAWIMNQDIYQKAITTQAELMINARSEKVRSDAANSILTHLKRPEKKEIELNVAVKETSGMRELKDALTKLADQQKALIHDGVQTKDIAHQPLVKRVADVVEAEVVEVVAPKTDRAGISTG